MRKNKLFKTLLVLGMSLTTATSIIGFTACNNDEKPDDSKTTHTHVWATEWSTNESKHWHDCTAEGHDGTKNSEGDHVDSDGDGVCDVCEYDMTTPAHEHTYSAWVNNDPDGHYQTCTADGCTEEAGHKFNLAAHDTNGTDGACSVCGYKEGAVTPAHEHTLSAWVNTEADGHYKTCTSDDCTEEAGHKFELAAHDTNGADGSCSVCGYVPPVTIPTYAELVAKDNVIFNEDFSTGYEADEKLPLFSNVFGLKGLYSLPNTGSYDENYVKVSNGAAVQVANKDNVSMILDLGPVSGVVEGYFEITPDAMGSGWNIVQFYAGNSTVLNIRATANNGNFVLYDTAEIQPENEVLATANTLYKVYYKFDLVNSKVTIALNDTALVTDMTTTITELSGIKLIASNSGGRLLTIDNIVVNGTEMSVSDYQSLLNGRLKSAYEKYDATLYTTNYENLTTTYNAEKAKIEAATTIVDVRAAYIAGLDAMAAVKSDLDIAKDTAINELATYVEGKTQANYSEENWTALLGAQTNGVAAINAAADSNAVTAALNSAKTAIDAVPDSSEQAELNNRPDYQATIMVDKDQVDAVVFAELQDFANNINFDASYLSNTFLTLTTVGTTKYKVENSGSGLSTQSSVFTFTTTVANAELAINYYSTNSSRTLTIKDSAGADVQSAIASSSWSQAGGKITLATAGTYTIEFSAGEHKLTSITLSQTVKEEKTVTTKVNSVTVNLSQNPTSINDIVANVTLGLDYAGDTSYTDTVTTGYTVKVTLGGNEVTDLSVAGEYTITVIYGEGEATQYNSGTATYTVTAE